MSWLSLAPPKTSRYSYLGARYTLEEISENQLQLFENRKNYISICNSVAVGAATPNSRPHAAFIVVAGVNELRRLLAAAAVVNSATNQRIQASDALLHASHICLGTSRPARSASIRLRSLQTKNATAKQKLSLSMTSFSIYPLLAGRTDRQTATTAIMAKERKNFPGVPPTSRPPSSSFLRTKFHPSSTVVHSSRRAFNSSFTRIPVEARSERWATAAGSVATKKKLDSARLGGWRSERRRSAANRTAATDDRSFFACVRAGPISPRARGS